jgi:hypothetical protein
LAKKITKDYPKLGEDFKTSEAAAIKVLERAASFAQVIDGLAGGNPLRGMLYRPSPPTISSIVSALGNKKKE